MTNSPILEFIRSNPGMAQALSDQHGPDRAGRCVLCSAGAQTGKVRYPCTIRVYADEILSTTGGQVPSAVMAGCKHDQGDHQAEAVMDGKGNVVAHHYRCNGCGIIVRTQ